jgi:hypothetical protein
MRTVLHLLWLASSRRKTTDTHDFDREALAGQPDREPLVRSCILQNSNRRESDTLQQSVIKSRKQLCLRRLIQNLRNEKKI